MGHSLCPFQSLGLPEPGRAGWRSMVGAHGQPAPCPVHCNPSKAAAATRWQHPSHTLLFHTSPNSGAYLQASKRVSRLGTGAPLLFLGLTEGMRGSDLYHPSHPPHLIPTKHGSLSSCIFRKNTRRNSKIIHTCACLQLKVTAVKNSGPTPISAGSPAEGTWSMGF